MRMAFGQSKIFFSAFGASENSAPLGQGVDPPPPLKGAPLHRLNTAHRSSCTRRSLTPGAPCTPHAAPCTLHSQRCPREFGPTRNRMQWMRTFRAGGGFPLVKLVGRSIGLSWDHLKGSGHSGRGGNAVRGGKLVRGGYSRLQLSVGGSGPNSHDSVTIYMVHTACRISPQERRV